VAPVSGDNRTLAVRAALALLGGYKVALSPFFRGSCRFLPTCADYAAIAIERHGVLYGTWLAARRLARCHPLCTAGHDPVPMR
jgi:putative membrane protein insertion efficiency factor